MLNKDILTSQELYAKLAKYCAYQERCTQEVLEYARKLTFKKGALEEALLLLEEDKFLDDARFAISFVLGKFRIKHWGKIKIKYALQQKGIDSTYIEEALTHIDEERYEETLLHLIEKKGLNINDMDEKASLYRFLQSKGYSFSEISAALKKYTL